MLSMGIFLQILHADWAIVLFLVLSELKNIVTSNKVHYILASHCFLVASYIQGKSTKNTVNRVLSRTFGSRSFCRQIKKHPSRSRSL